MHKCHNLPPYKEDAKVGMVQFKKNLRNQKLIKLIIKDTSMHNVSWYL